MLGLLLPVLILAIGNAMDHPLLTVGSPMQNLLLLSEPLGRGRNFVAAEGVGVVGADRQGSLGGPPASPTASADDGQDGQQQDATSDADDDPHPRAALVQA